MHWYSFLFVFSYCPLRRLPWKELQKPSCMDLFGQGSIHFTYYFFFIRWGGATARLFEFFRVNPHPFFLRFLTCGDSLLYIGRDYSNIHMKIECSCMIHALLNPLSTNLNFCSLWIPCITEISHTTMYKQPVE